MEAINTKIRDNLFILEDFLENHITIESQPLMLQFVRFPVSFVCDNIGLQVIIVNKREFL